MAKAKSDLRGVVMDIIMRFFGQQNVLTVNVPLIDATGSIEAALFLSQLIYWSDRSTIAGGWVAKTYAEWYEELRLTKRQVFRISKRLQAAGVETKVAKFAGLTPVHYRINRDTFYKWLEVRLLEAESGKAEHPEVTKRDFQKLQNVTSDSNEMSLLDVTKRSIPLTETTAETTTLSAANAAHGENEIEINPVPENQEVAKPKQRTTRKRDLLFDAVAALIFKYTGTVNPKAGGRVALVANTIRQCSDGVPDSELASEVRQFVEWWAVRYPNTDVPISDVKIAVHWQAWRDSTSVAGGLTPYQMKAAEYLKKHPVRLFEG